ncbi:GNAT family N-acetyltransferase [Deminuibacter soli]|uniref:N-acetyltransferase n=1 Tax=Deminuibacter soli TaxID=2291815 RepID=A0A3E1NRG9_9BACT|nr:N-acetyltransferase [Deminuibacter soli]RFM30500.1 N-acetyltransferase [Deminuibacter soli]
MDPEVIIRIAKDGDVKYALAIVTEMESSAKARGTGIARRTPEMIGEKIKNGNAVIAVTRTGEWVGFSYIEPWSNGTFVSNCGLIVSPAFRHLGVATGIKKRIFELSRMKYPLAKIFSITTGMAIMKINHDLGFKPVTFSAVTQDDAFWDGCRSCVNYSILEGKCRQNCLCTAMLYDPAEHISCSDEALVY